VAAAFFKLEFLKNIELGKMYLNAEESNKLLATNSEGRTVIHLAADFYKLEIFHGIVNWTKENLAHSR
jgi:endo-1,4-beta-D-glucanase Y